MNEEELAKERFVANYKDEIIKKSQCSECINNEGFNCRAFGEKPWEFADANSKFRCPERKI